MLKQLLLGFNFFCLETKETKIQDLKLFAKNKSCSLKILNLREFTIVESVLSLSRASDNRIFLTFSEFIFLTLRFPMSLLKSFIEIFGRILNDKSRFNYNNFLVGFNFFCPKTKETKIQDLDLSAKNKSCSLKILNLREFIIVESVLSMSRASDRRIFLTFSGVIFLTLRIPMSLLKLLLEIFSFFQRFKYKNVSC
jgi:hypothetical protein